MFQEFMKYFTLTNAQTFLKASSYCGMVDLQVNVRWVCHNAVLLLVIDTRIIF